MGVDASAVLVIFESLSNKINPYLEFLALQSLPSFCQRVIAFECEPLLNENIIK